MSVSHRHGGFNRRRIVVGLVSIVALSIGAATITSMTGGTAATVPDIGMGGGFQAPSIPGPPVAIPELPSDGTTGIVMDLSWCAPYLSGSLGGIGFFGAFGAVIYGIKRRYSLGVAAFSAYGLSPVVLTAYFLSTQCATAGGGGGGQGPGGQPPTGPPGPQGIEVSPLLVGGLVGFVLLGTAAVLYRIRDTEQALEPVEPDASMDSMGETDVSDLADAARSAAERLEAHNADVDNEVYRAWWEMTSLLDVPNPHSCTPGEFADAAVDVGLAREDVEELTQLFNEVRYGQRDPAEREAHARRVFRTIGQTYGDEADATE